MNNFIHVFWCTYALFSLGSGPQSVALAPAAETSSGDSLGMQAFGSHVGLTLIGNLRWGLAMWNLTCPLDDSDAH